MQIQDLLVENDIHEYKLFDKNMISIDPEVRELCKANACGHYGRNHMCPPAVQGIEKWRQEIMSFGQTVLVSKVYSIKDSFDLKGMHKGAGNFEKTLRQIKEAVQINGNKTMVLGAGPCLFCKECTCIDNEPCRFPDKPHPSVEACGVDVVGLSRALEMKYYNGENTVTYFGLILFDEN